MRYFLGLDVAKDSLVAALLDESGRLLQCASFANQAEGFLQLVAWLPDPRSTIALCEPTGVYGQRLKYALCVAVESLHEINAQTLKRFSFTQVRTKTDSADAQAIAQAVRTLWLTRPEMLHQSRVHGAEQRENLALWLGEYDRLRAAIAALRQQIASLAYQVAGDVPQVKRRREQKLARLLAQQQDVLRQVQRAYEALDDTQAQLIDSIPGLGPVATAATLVVVRDIRRFKSADALKAYLGMYPRRCQSGPREGASHLARHGSRLMRHVLWNAAKAAVRVKHPGNPFRLLFDRLVAKGKSKVAAYGAVSRKLVQVLYGVLKSQTPFQFAPAP
jgi:transposase